MTPKQHIKPVVRRCDFEDRLKMVDGLFFLSFRSVYVAENQMKFAGKIFFPFPRDEMDWAGCGVLRGVELFVFKQRLSKATQRLHLFFCVVGSLENIQRFLCLLYPFLVKP